MLNRTRIYVFYLFIYLNSKKEICNTNQLTTSVKVTSVNFLFQRIILSPLACESF